MRFRRITGRAWSRAGAVAAVLASGAPRRALTTAARTTYLIAGSALIAGGVALTLRLGLGAGPLDVFIGAVSERTGVAFTFVLWATVATMLAVATLLGRRPGPGTVAAPLLIGPLVEATLAGLDVIGTPSSVAAQVPLQLVGIAMIGLGSGMLIVSGLGAGTGELLAAAAADRTGRADTVVRTGIELAWIATGVALGGPAGVGTVMVAALIGPAVARGHRLADRVAMGTHRSATATHAMIIERERRAELALADAR